MKKHQTREQWLVEATKLLDKLVFAPLGERVPKENRVSCSFPSVRALSAKRPRIGECWDKVCSTDKHVEVMISPRLDKPVDVLDTLAHEHIHGIVGCACGHKGPFAKLARKIGLEGKLTSTTAGAELRKTLEKIAKELGPYPHAKINAWEMDRKKQTTRMIKVECKECGYTARTTRTWLEEKGSPLCPCNCEPMHYELPDEEDE